MSGGAKYEYFDHVGLITIDRPAVRNAIDSATSYLIDSFIDQAENDPDVGAVVITGSGDRAFCSGMDLKEAAKIGPETIREGHVMIPNRGLAGITERQRKKPLIAAVNGSAVAGGFEIVLAADIIVACDTALFALPEPKRGLFAFGGGIQRLSKLLPRSTALEIIFTGDFITAQRLFELGVVSQITSQEALMDVTLELARGILRNSWTAIQNSKALFDMATDLSIIQALRIGKQIGFASFRHPDAATGISAYVSGREAEFPSKP